MWRLKRTWCFVVNLLTAARKDRELDDEIRCYADLLSDQNVSRGMSRDEAQRHARMDIGGVEQLKEEIRAKRSGAALRNFLQDLRYAARTLRQKPAFAAVAVATIAIGIGANTAIFSVIDATLLTPVPVPSPERVAMVWTEDKAHRYHHLPASVPDYRDWKASGVFAHLAAILDDGLNIRIGDRTERVPGMRVTPEWFPILGAKPILGRTFTPDEAKPGHGNVVILGWNFWNSHYQHSRSVIGTSIVIDGTPHAIIGVLPSGVAHLAHEELWVPAVFDGPNAQSRGTRSWLVVGRIAPGLSLDAAERRMIDLNKRIARQYPHEERGLILRLQPIEEMYVEDVKPVLLLVFGAVGFVLLIACANIANLLLAHGTARRKEISIRVALGASRGRIMAQLLSESVLLALLGAAVGILPAYAAVDWIPKVAGDLPNADLIALNGPVLLFAFALAVLAAAIFGFLPALQLRNSDTNQSLRESERGQSSRQQNRLGSVFVIAEIAFTMVLLAGAGLMVRNLLQLRTHNPGYDQHGVLAMQIALMGSEFQQQQKQTVFLNTALEQFVRIPGVEAAAATDALPGSDIMHASGIHFTDRPEPRPADVPIVLTASVSAGYFQCMRIPLQKGRTFAPGDDANAPLVAMIDSTAAKKLWPNEEPIGKKITLERHGPARTIIGIAGAVEQNPLVTAMLGQLGQVYTPLPQVPKPGLSLVVRTGANPTNITPAIRRIVASLDRDVPLYKVGTMEDMRAEGRASAQMATILLAMFGIIALLLASIGIFGIVAYTVGQRVREFGIRIAVGATASDLLKITLGRGALLVGTGTLLGLVGAAALAQLVNNVLSGISPNDPLTFAAATVILVTIGLLASYLPARRASRVDPTVALRLE
jgi:putative ABC transport system permease protein